MNQFPRITIITPSFNQGHFIEQTITSVLDQGYPNLEYIIIDGGSNDNTLEIIKKYEKHISYWTSENDKGQSDAINKGISRATGEVINWLNSDDYYQPGALNHVGSIFQNENVTAYCGRSRVFSESSEKISQGTDVYKGNLAKTIGWARIDQPETFFRKKVWDIIGSVNQSFHYVMDKELWVRYLCHFGLDGIVQDDEVLVNFRIHENSKTGSQIQKFREETFDLFYSIAVEKELLMAEKLTTLTSSREKALFGYEKIDSGQLEIALEYFMLHVALEAYAENKYQMAKKAADLIRTNFLRPDDVRALKKTLFRMNILPVGTKIFFNNFRKWMN